MGRLFWKFFIFFWLAQLLTTIGVGIAIWLTHGDHLPERHIPPPPPFASVGAEHPGPGAGPPPHLRPPLMPILAGSVVSLGFAGLLAWYSARPIRSLRAAFDSLANGEFDTRIGDTLAHRRDEFTDLGADFDRMAGRLGNLVAGQRRLLHDVSHELRSPLARLQAAVGLMEQQPERSKELVARIHRDTDRMDRLVGELLALARLNGSVTDNVSEPMQVKEIVAEVADRVQLEIEPKQCRLDTTVAFPLVVLAHRELLVRALENVVRNAVRHSPEGGRIGITAKRDDEQRLAVIEIADEGAGVPETDVEAIFTPFYRTEKIDWSNGFGLGLSITRRIVEAHGGTVVANNRLEGGLGVVMRLPLHDGPDPKPRQA